MIRSTMKELIAKEKKEISTLSYRMSCSSSGNGLSHYIMYGDIPEESTYEDKNVK